MVTTKRVLVGVIALFVVIGIINAATGKKSTTASKAATTKTVVSSPVVQATVAPTPPTSPTVPLVYKQVHAVVIDVEALLGEAQKNETPALDNQAATAAQQAHDTLNGYKQNNVSDFGSSDAGVNAWDSVDGLKNAMGALVAYLGSPNPATLASFKTQFNSAQAEWNDAVHTLYPSAGLGL